MSPSLFTVLAVPAPLAGMAFPDDDTDWRALHRLGFRRVVRLHPGDYDPAPLELDVVGLEDLFGGRAPRDPLEEEARIRTAARLAAESIARGEGVVVHCLGGTGRTGTVLACALRLLGRSTDEAIAAVREHRPAWPESPWHAAVVSREPGAP